VVTVQLPYSLAARGIEPEFIPMAQALGLGLTAWSPLAGGLLTGKYRRSPGGVTGDGRLGNPDVAGLPVTGQTWQVIEALESVAGELGKPMAQVALNWAATQPAVSSLVIGASGAGQLDGNLAALDFEIPADARQKLDEASAPAVPQLYQMFTPEYQSYVVSPGLGIGDKPASFARPVWNGAARP
jgi:aryl-alcohol dehydrogenase-like predicted oxidoreductase